MDIDVMWRGFTDFRRQYEPTLKAMMEGVGALTAGFWYCNLATSALDSDGEFHVLPIGGVGVNGNKALIESLDDGVKITAAAVVVSVKFWAELSIGTDGQAKPPDTGWSGNSQLGIQIDKAGSLLVRGQVPIVSTITMAQATYDGYLVAGEIIRPVALCDANDTLAVLASSYMTVMVTSAVSP